MRIRIQGFDDQKLQIWQLNKIFWQILIYYPPKASMEDVQGTEEAFNPQKWTFSISKHEIS